MVTSNTKQTAELNLIRLGLVCLSMALLFGLIGSLQYLLPGLFKSFLSFEKVRPLHVSSAVFWILHTASGSVLIFFNRSRGTQKPVWTMWQYRLMLLAYLFIFISYLAGQFGGREYWEFPPLISLLIVLSWLLFLIQVFQRIPKLSQQPVYVWMWLTGIVTFLFTFLESNLWLIPYFRQHIVQDMTIQWKSYGSMVGSWNMLIYGCGLYVMDQIKGDATCSRKPIAFWLYFIGLTNLMFNWGHHIYTLPGHVEIRQISYLVSMSELFILGRIIFLWQRSVTESQRFKHQLVFSLLNYADWWVALNLVLAILISIPALQLFTHGTHITVAHAMGTTIGINSMMLLAIVFFIKTSGDGRNSGSLKIWIQVLHYGLLIFWIALLASGLLRGAWQRGHINGEFQSMMTASRPFFFFVMLGGLMMILAIFRIVFGFFYLRAEKVIE
ncbi:MAG: cbb3-type cytochrome c oxidase subunit I [Chitinophagaceae bacterium]|nr:cbb3-type cytochrome c oxidase subunit I [Chitinophagaceae bacterium]